MSFNFSKIIIISAFLTISSGYGQKSKSKSTSIDFTHWTLALPAEDPKKNGKVLNIEYPEIMDYENNEIIKKYMYADTKDKSLVFYAYPSGTTTANSHFSRTELRETMVTGDNNTNWTFPQGGYFKGTYAMDEVSLEKDGKYSKVIIAQIHGRLSDKQRDLIGQKDNNAAPVLKIYWDNGKIRVKTKVLKNQNASEKDMLPIEAWQDDEGRNFKEKVDFNKFTLEIKVSDGRLEVILNENESFVYNDLNMKKWGIFENYFKAGNYFQSKDPNAFAKVKIYSLLVTH